MKQYDIQSVEEENKCNEFFFLTYIDNHIKHLLLHTQHTEIFRIAKSIDIYLKLNIFGILQINNKILIFVQIYCKIVEIFIQIL